MLDLYITRCSQHNSKSSRSIIKTPDKASIRNQLSQKFSKSIEMVNKQDLIQERVSLITTCSYGTDQESQTLGVS